MASRKKNESNQEEEKELLNIDSIKEELKDYIDKAISKEINTELEKTNKRIIKEKNFKILVKNFVITLLLLIIVYLVYLLNNAGYFSRQLEPNEKYQEPQSKEESKDEKEIKEEAKKLEPTQEELSKKYAYLLDKIFINENSVYLKDYYDGKLTDELKRYLSLNYLSKESITTEDNYSIIDETKFKAMYEALFDGEYVSKNFDYNGNKIRYISALKSYVSDIIIEENTTNIIKQIKEIKESENGVKIVTIEGLVKDKKLYNIVTSEEVGEYSEQALNNNKDKLTTITYYFDTNNKLLKIEK